MKAMSVLINWDLTRYNGQIVDYAYTVHMHNSCLQFQLTTNSMLSDAWAVSITYIWVKRNEAIV